MTVRAKPHPSLLLVLVPIAVTAVAVYVVAGAGQHSPAAYRESGICSYALLLCRRFCFGPLGRTVERLALHCTGEGRSRWRASSAFWRSPVFTRCGSRPARTVVESRVVTWDRALSYLDMVAVFSAIAGFVRGGAARISRVPSR